MGPLVPLIALPLKVLHQIDHLDGQLPLHGVVGQNAGKKELLVVRVGGDQQEVGLLQRGLPHLHPAGQLAGGEGVNLPDGRPRRELQGHAVRRFTQPGGHIHILMEKAVFPAGLCLVQRPGLREAVELNINPGNSVRAGDGDLPPILGNGPGIPGPVPELPGVGKSLRIKVCPCVDRLLGVGRQKQGGAEQQKNTKDAWCFHRWSPCS